MECRDGRRVIETRVTGVCNFTLQQSVIYEAGIRFLQGYLSIPGWLDLAKITGLVMSKTHKTPCGPRLSFTSGQKRNVKMYRCKAMFTHSA